ncbi:MAG TPA: hypothetical protein VM939_03445 [Gemmatimonadaceae bacterium]|nr:hypothetical protein [Gemmatimonadaceae bacterium]
MATFEGTPMCRAARFSVPVALFALAACSDSTQDPLDPIATANPLFGQLAFEQACSSCHATKDGFDLKTFGFADTTIIRRAVKHVDTATARNIVAYIRTLQAPPNNRTARLFQPGNGPLTSDIEFAVAVFGRDAWPDGLTTAQLTAVDTRALRVAIQLPVWSDEKSNMDWMPDDALPTGILDYSGGFARAAIAGYHASPTAENLVRAVNALRNADRAAANANAPCLLDDTVRVKYRQCFEVRRWTSTLVAQHMLRYGPSVVLGGKVHDVWWDVGNAARKSRADRSMPIANVKENWATWMFLGWSFDPSLHSSSYTGGGFRELGLMRHATFVALRSQVARPKNSNNVYEDLVNAVRFAPANWAAPVATFGLRHLNERLTAGERPPNAELKTMAIMWVNSALTEANKKVPVADRAKLQSLAQPVLERLTQQ